MFYTFDAKFIDYTEITKRHEKSVYSYILYRFRDIHTNQIHYLYDHKNNKHIIKSLTNDASYRISGRVTTRKMQHFCNIDAVAIIEPSG